MIPAPRIHPSAKVTRAVVSDLIAIVGAENVLHRADEMLVYECDGYIIEKNVPDVVVFPTSTEQVVEIVKLCNRHDVPFVPRGAGTSLAGGTLTIGGGVMICLTRMKRILEVNIRDRYAIVEPGVVNVWLTRSLAGTGLPLRPRPVEPGGLHDRRQRRDQLRRPAHAQVRRDGQPHQGGELVLPDGTVVETGGITEDNPGYDLTGLIVGNEGTFGIVTKVGRQPDAQPRGRPDAAGRLRDGRRGHQDHQRDHRRRHRAGRAGDARQPDDPGGRAGLPLRLSRSTPAPC